MTFKAQAPEEGVFSNRFGYRQKAPEGTFTVTSGLDGAMRVHDGFAVFTTKQQADWVCELLQAAKRMGAQEAQSDMRRALGMEDE